METLTEIFGDKKCKLGDLVLLKANVPITDIHASVLDAIVCWTDVAFVDKFILLSSTTTLMSQSDLVDLILQRLLLKNTLNILSFGYRKLSESSNACVVGGSIENYFPNSFVSLFKNSHWRHLLTLYSFA
jgi:hypothetical protein